MFGKGRKIFHALIILQLNLTFFGMLARPDVCFCGHACGPCCNEEVEKEEKVTYHKRCREGECKTCNFERMINFDTCELYTRDPNQEHHVTLDSVFVSIDSLHINPTVDRLNAVTSRLTGHPTLHYLENCSLLF